MFATTTILSFLALSFLANGQQAGNLTKETHPTMSWSKCSSGGSCTTTAGQVVLDSNWRWLHWKANYTNCYDGNEWDTSACSSAKTCATNCALDGADYRGTYGITTSGNSMTMVFVTEGEYSTNIGSRVYMMASETKYMMYKLLNQVGNGIGFKCNNNLLCRSLPSRWTYRTFPVA
jgi:cellulose 1,4-beta-cellobiosidase